MVMEVLHFKFKTALRKMKHLKTAKTTLEYHSALYFSHTSRLAALLESLIQIT